MNIMVVHKNGLNEVITLTEPVTIVRGEKMNRLRTSTGMEHWFDEDGTYDGWGTAMHGPAEDAWDFVERQEADREFIKGKEVGHTVWAKEVIEKTEIAHAKSARQLRWWYLIAGGAVLVILAVLRLSGNL